MPSPKPGGVLSVYQAARMANLTPGRIYQFCRERRFRSVKLHSKCWLIDRESFREFLKEYRPAGNPNWR